MRPRIDIIDRKEEIARWVSEGYSNAEIARLLSCNIDTLKAYYKRLGIIYILAIEELGVEKETLRENQH